MSVPLISNAFIGGELAPSLFGRTDIERYHVSATTMRNGFVNYRGGYYSRAGTAFVGFSKQTGRTYPPRLLPFQFSINQGLALEFGHQYMRVVANGAFVTEGPLAISGATQANPCVITVSATGAASATPNDGAVVNNYAPGDLATLAGGTYLTPAILAVTNTKLLALYLGASGAGIGYAPADTLALTGGTQTTPAQLTVTTTQIVSATIAAAGSGGTDGTQTVTGTTGTGTKFQVSVTVAAGVITAVLGITVHGSYTVNPTTPAMEPVTGASLTGAQLNVVLGINTFSISNAGVFTANPSGFTFTQASTSGGGTGATFQFALMGPNAVSVSNAGVYSIFPANPVAQASTNGSGQGATFTVSTVAVGAFNTGDWVYASSVVGMTQLNGQTYVLTRLSTSTYSLHDVYGNNINSTGFGAYVSGGTAARIFTLTTIYSETDLAWLKTIESADVMTICCVNQITGTEYPPQDLSRIGNTNWTFTPVVPAPTVQPPSGFPAGQATNTGKVNYGYEITAVDPNNGTESVASLVCGVPNAIDIALNAGSITLTWNPVTGVGEYNVYKTTPGYETPIVVGSLYGYIGTATGPRFIDSNIIADFAQTPPLHKNPFARGQVIGGTVISGGANYTTATAAITTGTGSGARLLVVVNTGLTPSGGTLVATPGPVVAIIVTDPGQDYLPSDTITISGDGSGATATLQIGALTGTYPSVPSYFQSRRVFAGTLNNPDTYFMSQPGAYSNFDTRIPTIDSDAITGTPWSVQVNGVQFLLQTAPGLLVFTGLSAWLLVGAGSFATNVQALTPSSQDVNRQAFTGCSATVQPIPINYDVIYLTAKGSFYYDLPYQLYALSEPIDLTQYSSHLFVGYTIKEHAWCEQPYKLLWAVRNDGVMLSLTFLKAEQVAGWARHDTQGLFESVCSVTEPPVDALYCATKRFPGTNTAYMIERMDNRIWSAAENAWCVDAGLTLAQPTPNATLSASSATGLGSITGVTGLVGGSNYGPATTAAVVDNNGEGTGTGAVPTLTIIGGVITAVTFAGGSQGSGYAFPALVITDPSGQGSGASASPVLNNSATFTATGGAPFSIGNVGSVIRMGGGIATITAYNSSTSVTANILSPIVQLIPNTGTPAPQPSGSWTMSAPVTVVRGLNHLIGATVGGLADGNIVGPFVVDATGSVTLNVPASVVTLGLTFKPQLQSTYLDAGAPTMQGQRKKVAAVTARVEASRNIRVGANQVDGSTMSPPSIAPTWKDLVSAPPINIPSPKPYNALCGPLFTGDIRVPLQGGYTTYGQIALEQDNPVPMNILALIGEDFAGDEAEVKAPPRQRGGA